MWMGPCGVCIELSKKVRLCDSAFFLRIPWTRMQTAAKDTVQRINEPLMTAHWTMESCHDGSRRLVRHWFKNETADVLYLLRLMCRSEGENRARALLLHRTQKLPISLRSLHSGSLTGTDNVEVHANFHSTGRRDTMLENIVGRMILEPTITAAGWQLLRQ